MDKEDDQGEEDEGADRWDADAIGSLSIGAKLSLKVCLAIICQVIIRDLADCGQRPIEALEKIWTEHETKINSA